MKSFLKSLLGLIFVVAISVVFFKYYSYIFAKTVIGQITNIEKVTNAVAVVGGASAQNIGNRELFSVAVLIKDLEGKFWTTSAEDRQWGIAEIGTCVQAKLFPYPPWNFEKGGTFYGARLVQVMNCESIGLKTPVPTTGNQ